MESIIFLQLKGMRRKRGRVLRESMEGEYGGRVWRESMEGEYRGRGREAYKKEKSCEIIILTSEQSWGCESGWLR